MYRKELDGLRAIAIIAVILNHIKQGLCLNGYLGVDMFFVLSGFVITKSLIEREKMDFFPFLKDFWKRRVKRLFPALFAVVTFTIFTTFLFSSHESHHTTMSIETGLSSLIGIGNLYLANMATDYFSTTAELNAFTHTWSLGVEEQFYLLFPLLFWGLLQKGDKKKTFVLVLSILTTLSVLFFLKNFEKHPIKVFYLVHSRFWELSLGSLVFLASNRLEVMNHSFRQTVARLSYFLLPIFLSLLIVLLFDSKYPNLSEKYYNILIVLLTAGILLFLDSNSSVVKLLQWKPITFIGILSYSLYLWHWPIITFFRWTFGIKNHLIPLILILCFCFSYLSYRMIESPLRYSEWRWKWLNKARSLSPTTLSISTAILFIILIRVILYPFYLNGSFYLGTPAKLKSKGVHNLLSPVIYQSETWDPQNCVLANNKDLGKNITSENCSFGKQFKSKQKYLVLGNSYSAAQVYMFQVLPENHSMVTITSSLGSFPAPNLTFANNWEKTNRYYWNEVVPKLTAELKENDGILMVYDLSSVISEEEKMNLFISELSQFVSTFKNKKINVIFQHTIPLMRESNCNPDLAQKQWWHKFQEPPCLYFSKEETLNRRRPFHDKLINLKKEHSNFYVLDLMDVFCPEKECQFVNKKGEFLYRDEYSHPSIEASILAKTSLWQVIQKIN
ncbi:acyltransferase [Leptospira mtsangambouensis]|uniref:Acyltransferase n=1 Tax=Leptospira mtsangambouensis TaxID=2484912 RepID=A0ABY2P5A9_9LEPT|nr:acyltransferase family protein [Leptospira mtsangambouensis]TGM82302.1 acyltransferase [Leptospira mtsangambouensis]